MDFVLLATLLVIFGGFHVPGAGHAIDPGANLTEAQSASAERSHRLVKVTNRFEMERSKVDQVPGAPHPPAQTAQLSPALTAQLSRHDWHKYNFVRRMRKDVLAQSDLNGSTFGQHSADKCHNSPIGQQPAGASTFEPQLAEERVNSSLTHPPIDAAGDSPLAHQPANSGSSQLATQGDSSSFGHKLTDQGSSPIEQQPAKGGPSSTLGQQPVVEQPLVNEGNHSTTVQQPTNQASNTVSNSQLANSNSAHNHQVAENPQPLPLQPSAMHKPIAGTELQSIGTLSLAQDLTAAAPVANAPTASHSNSAAISTQKASSVDQPALQLNPTLTSNLKAQEQPATNKTEALPTSTHHSVHPADLQEPPIAVSKEHIAPSQKFSNSQTIQLNSEPIILAAVSKGSYNELTNFSRNDSKFPTEELVLANGVPGGLIPFQPLPAARYSISSNQPAFVIWNPFGASNNSKASQNLASNSSHHSDSKNGSLGSNGPTSKGSSEKESASSDDDSSEFPDEQEIKLVDTIKASPAEIPQLKNPAESHEPTTTGAGSNISSSTASSFKTQHILQNKKLAMVPQQSLQTAASFQDQPMILVPTWVLMTRYPVHTADQNAIEFPKHRGQASSSVTSIKN